MTLQKDQFCMECGIGFKGRIDKKFCSDQCRTVHNNRLKSIENTYIKKVNNILKRNRRILAKINPDGKRKVSAEKLKSMGFNFNYYTSSWKTKDGARYFYCYDQGYLPMDREQCLLVVKKISTDVFDYP